jgi:HAD superfamily hydrolase (TIGR01509 family)
MRTVNPAPRRELERRLGLPPGGVSKVVFESPRWDEVQLGHISSAEFWADVGQRLGLSAGELEELQRTFWAGDRLDEELVALVRGLRDQGYRTALLSNAPADSRQRLEHLGIVDAFGTIIISGCEGLMKPDPAIFSLTLERVGVRAEQAVFVDDSRVNVAAAQQFGLQAIHFRGLVPLRKRLRDLGVFVYDPLSTPLSDVRAVIFDWAGVIEASLDDAYIVGWERRLALGAGTLPKVLWGEMWRRLEVGAITSDDFRRYVADQIGFPDVETAGRFIEEFYTGEWFLPQMADVVRALRGRYKVALLTNAFPEQDDWIREQFGFDVHTEFDVYVNSAWVGLRKPDPAIFYLTLERLDVAPHQAVFVDDSLRNVDAARELGIHTVQFVDPATSLAELEALLGFRVHVGEKE